MKSVDTKPKNYKSRSRKISDSFPEDGKAFFLGILKGTVHIKGNIQSPVDVEWDACKRFPFK